MKNYTRFVEPLLFESICNLTFVSTDIGKFFNDIFVVYLGSFVKYTVLRNM